LLNSIGDNPTKKWRIQETASKIYHLIDFEETSQAFENQKEEKLDPRTRAGNVRTHRVFGANWLAKTALLAELFYWLGLQKE